jgi:hypothetical protein
MRVRIGTEMIFLMIMDIDKAEMIFLMIMETDKAEMNFLMIVGITIVWPTLLRVVNNRACL